MLTTAVIGATRLDHMFDDYIDRWWLMPDGDPILTRTSRLLPVRWQGNLAILKIAIEAEEKRGNELMAWWHGEGVPTVLARDREAVLLQRAQDESSLAHLVRKGCDDEATRIICTVAGRLHSPRDPPLPRLVPLSEWFEDLGPAADLHGGIFPLAAATAHDLLSAPREISVLHGDIHHDNILQFGDRGWLAIDPKGLIGERAFDYANLFCNPDSETATNPERFGRRLEIVSEVASLDRTRLLRWLLAWGGLSAAWMISDHINAETPLRVAELAAAELRRQNI
jgi:streptomycin 6-kinase